MRVRTVRTTLVFRYGPGDSDKDGSTMASRRLALDASAPPGRRCTGLYSYMESRHSHTLGWESTLGYLWTRVGAYDGVITSEAQLLRMLEIYEEGRRGRFVVHRTVQARRAQQKKQGPILLEEYAWFASPRWYGPWLDQGPWAGSLNDLPAWPGQVWTPPPAPPPDPGWGARRPIFTWADKDPELATSRLAQRVEPQLGGHVRKRLQQKHLGTPAQRVELLCAGLLERYTRIPQHTAGAIAFTAIALHLPPERWAFVLDLATPGPPPPWSLATSEEEDLTALALATPLYNPAAPDQERYFNTQHLFPQAVDTPERLSDALERLADAWEERLAKSHSAGQTLFYGWYDQQAGQIRFSLATEDPGSLFGIPDGRRVKVLSSALELVNQYYSDPHPGFVPNDELLVLPSGIDFEDPPPSSFPPLPLWVRALSW